MKINAVQKSAGEHFYERQEGCFESLSVVIPVINEVKSLHQTIDAIFEYAGENIREVIIVICNKTTTESQSASIEIGKRYAGQIRIIKQKLPFLGGALREGLFSACGSHVIVMFSDGESDPRNVADLVRAARANPQAIISVSRWLKRKSFEGYPAVKTLWNYLFQKSFAFLYWTNITDFTFGYRSYPLPLIYDIEWKETGHSFVLESILKPLCLKINVLEIPGVWKARSEGESQLKPYMYLRYLWIGLQIRFTQRKYFME